MRPLAIALLCLAPAARAIEPLPDPVILTIATDLPGKVFDVQFDSKYYGTWPCGGPVAAAAPCKKRVPQTSGILVATTESGGHAVSREFFASPGNDRWRIGYGKKQYYGYWIGGISLAGAGALTYAGIKTDAPFGKLGLYTGAVSLAVLAEIFLIVTWSNNGDAGLLRIRAASGEAYY